MFFYLDMFNRFFSSLLAISVSSFAYSSDSLTVFDNSCQNNKRVFQEETNDENTQPNSSNKPTSLSKKKNLFLLIRLFLFILKALLRKKLKRMSKRQKWNMQNLYLKWDAIITKVWKSRKVMIKQNSVIFKQQI